MAVSAETKKIPFNFTYFAMKLLGKNLYSNPWTAISEIVANGVDANADNVYVLVDMRNKEHAIVEIFDDGKGMARRSQPSNVPEELRQSLVELLTNFAEELQKEDLREKVVALVPAFHKLRDLGSSLIPQSEAASARERIIAYLKQYPRVVIDGDELMVVSGINEWARRVRELRVQFGWWIYSGVTFNQMAQNPDDEAMFRTIGINPKTIRPDQYVLMREEQDRDAAHRWNVLNEIRKKKVSVKEKIIEYLRKNVGTPVTGEELSYLAGNTKEWARRVRELRTEDGWPIVTKNTGRNDLPVGVYVLEEDRQA